MNVVSFLLLQILLCLVTLLFCSTKSVSATDSCYRLDDPEAPIRDVLPLFPNFNYTSLVAKLPTFLLSSKYGECIASYNGATVVELVSLFQQNGVCSIEKTRGVFDNANLMSTFNLFPQTISDFNPFSTYILSLSDDSFKNMCVPITTQFMPCVSALLPLIVKLAQSNANGCCQGVLGSDLVESDTVDSDLIDIMQNFANLLCNTRPSFSDRLETQTCGYTMSNLFLTRSSWTFAKRFMAGWHIPNDEACNAYNGLPYFGSDKRKTTFYIGTSEVNVGSCADELDMLFSSIKASASENPESKLSLLFGETCLRGDLALAFLSKYFHPIFAQVFNLFVGEYTCFHLPTGFSPCNNNYILH